MDFPRVVNWKGKVVPGLIVPELKLAGPVSDTTVWTKESLFVQITVVPDSMVKLFGVKTGKAILIDAVGPANVVVVEDVILWVAGEQPMIKAQLRIKAK